MQFTLSFELYIYQNEAHTKQFVAVEVFIYLYVFVFYYKCLFVCETDTACPRIAKPAYCFIIFRSVFGLLFCLRDRKLILGSKPTWQSMRKLPSTVSSAETFSQMDKERTLFFHENCILVCVLKLFLDNYPFKYT